MLKKIQEMKDEDGFTLIELMVVVLIIAILIAIAIPTFLGLRSRAQNRAAQSDLRNGLTAAKAFYTDSENYDDFDKAAAELTEPSLTFNDTAGSTTEIGIVVSAGDEVVLTRQSESDEWYCGVDNEGLSGVHGPADAEADLNTAATCGALPRV